jgi:hypothetical protein
VSGSTARAGKPIAATLCVVAAGAVVLTSALPWATFGTRHRSGFALAIAARQAGVFSGGAQRLLAVAWLSLPLAAAIGLAGAVLRQTWLAVAGAAACGAVGIAAAVGVLQSPTVGSEYGVWASIACSALALVAAGSATVARVIRVTRKDAREPPWTT